MSPGLNKAFILIGAILGGVVLGYFLRNPARDGPPPNETQAPPPPEASHPQRDIRPLTRPIAAKELSMESQQRLRELEALAAGDPRKALNKLPAFRDTELLPLAITALARGWARTDPQAAARWASELETSEDQVSAALGLVPVWAAGNPEECLAWAGNQPAGNMREVSLVEIADTWGSKEPEKALGRYLSMPAEDGTERGLHAITSQWALDDPDKAIASVAALPADQRRDEFLETVLVSLTNEDPEHAWSEATRFSDPKRIEHVRCMAVEAMAETRPQDALRLAASVGNPPALLESIAGSWLAWDEKAASAWISSIDDPQLRESLQSKINR